MRHHDVLVRLKDGVRFLRTLPENFQSFSSASGVYLSELHDSEDDMCLAPFARRGVTNQVSDTLGREGVADRPAAPGSIPDKPSEVSVQSDTTTGSEDTES